MGTAGCLSVGRDDICVCQVLAGVKCGQCARRSRLELGKVLTESLFFPDIGSSGEIVFHMDWVCTAQQHVLLWDWAGEAQPGSSHVVIPTGAVCQGGCVAQLGHAWHVPEAAVTRSCGRGQGQVAPGSVAVPHLSIVGEGVAVQRVCLSWVTEPRHLSVIGKCQDRNSPSLLSY